MFSRKAPRELKKLEQVYNEVLALVQGYANTENAKGKEERYADFNNNDFLTRFFYAFERFKNELKKLKEGNLLVRKPHGIYAIVGRIEQLYCLMDMDKGSSQNFHVYINRLIAHLNNLHKQCFK